MKNAVFILLALVAAAGLVWTGWALRGVSSTTASPHILPGNPPLASAVPTHPAPVPHPGLLAPDEWQKIRQARETTLQTNPALGAEYKALISEMQAQQDKLDAAMIKADPKVAPIIAKLVALREHNGAPNGPAPVK